MGQACKGGVFTCMDGGFVNTQEFLSEPSRKFENIHQIYKNESRDPIEDSVGKLDQPLDIYESEFNRMKSMRKNEKNVFKHEEFFRLGNSPRVKVISSNFSEKSLNLIERIEKTADTDKSSSSVLISQTK